MNNTIPRTPQNTTTTESFSTRLTRYGFNFFPAFRGTGGRITFIAHDFREARIKIPLNWRTKNYVGTIFGGSMFGATDPLFVVMLIKVLGRGYIVWDKASTINYKKPGRETLYATAKIHDDDIEFIHETLKQQEKLDRVFQIDIVNKDNIVHATIEKTLHIRKK